MGKNCLLHTRFTWSSTLAENKVGTVAQLAHVYNPPDIGSTMRKCQWMRGVVRLFGGHRNGRAKGLVMVNAVIVGGRTMDGAEIADTGYF